MASVLSCSSSSSNIQLANRRPMVAPPSLASIMFIRRRLYSSHHFFGLKIQQLSSHHWVPSLDSTVSHRVRSSIICKASSDTDVDVPLVTDETWESLVVKADGPVMVEFSAPWCGPCRVIHPIIVELSKQYVGRLKCYKLNTDESPSVAAEFGIRSIPTILIFVNGEKKDAIIGAVSKTAISACIQKFV